MPVSSSRFIAIVLLMLICLPFGVITAEQDATGKPTSESSLDVGKPKLLGVGEVPGDALDQSGLTDVMKDGTSQSQLGGFSAIEWLGGNRYLILPDRGPLDGAVDYLCRFHEAEIEFEPNGSQVRFAFKLIRTVILRDEQGRPFIGASRALEATDQHAHRLDPEGLRCDRDGNIYISDEYGPYLFKFSKDGQLLERFSVPAEFRIAKQSANGDEEDSSNKIGRRANRGMEGLALSPSGNSLVGLMQSPLLQDSYQNDKGKAVGLNTRLLTIDRNSGVQRQYVYRQDKDKHKMHEILAINDHQYLVIEQDGEEGKEAKFKKVTMIDLNQATPIVGDQPLPGKDLPDSIRPAKKSTYLDLLDPEYGLAGDSMPGKIEGITWGPQLDDGRRILIICSDNDFKRQEPSRLYIFSVSTPEVTLTGQ